MELYIKGFDIKKPLSEDYLNHIPAVKYMSSFEFTSPVTFFVGENGSGKSTLLEAIAVAHGFNSEGGTKNFNFATKSTHSSLHESMKLIKGYRYPKDGFFLRAESFYNAASEIDRLDTIGPPDTFIKKNYGGVSLHNQSHGESFLALALNRFHRNSLFILDEPEAALSPSRLMTLITRIHQLVQENCQFIISTHSPILMTFPGADIIQFTDDGVTHPAYQETEHYQLTRRFLENPERMLHYLLVETQGS